MLERYYPLTFLGHMVTLHSPQPLNIAALATRFSGIAGIVEAEANGMMGGGNDIIATRKADGWVLEFKFGWGDCPSGCINHHSWIFRTMADGEAEFIGTRGSPLPRPGEFY